MTFNLEREVQRANAEYFAQRFESFGYALAMRVMQSDLYAQLDDRERDECDALINNALRPVATLPASIRKGARPEDFDFFNRYQEEA